MTDPTEPDTKGTDAQEGAAAGDVSASDDPGPKPEEGATPILSDMPADSLAAVALDSDTAGPVLSVSGATSSIRSPGSAEAVDAPRAAGVAESPAVAAPAKAEEPELTAESLAALRGRPTYLFFGILAAVSLALDIGSKAWAEVELSKRTLDDPSIALIPDHLMFTLAYNRGGAWGLLHDASENIRKPFFLAVSVLAIAFIVSLYSRLAPGQRALKWGLPLVLGGALGNLSDRIIRSSVVDFIDFRADWIEAMNRGIAKLSKGWTITDHWPTFNVADIFICIGVGLMAIDMITSRRKPEPPPKKAGELAPAGEVIPGAGGAAVLTPGVAGPESPPEVAPPSGAGESPAATGPGETLGAALEPASAEPAMGAGQASAEGEASPEASAGDEPNESEAPA